MVVRAGSEGADFGFGDCDAGGEKITVSVCGVRPALRGGGGFGADVRCGCGESVVDGTIDVGAVDTVAVVVAVSPVCAVEVVCIEAIESLEGFDANRGVTGGPCFGFGDALPGVPTAEGTGFLLGGDGAFPLSGLSVRDAGVPERGVICVASIAAAIDWFSDVGAGRTGFGACTGGAELDFFPPSNISLIDLISSTGVSSTSLSFALSSFTGLPGLLCSGDI